MMAANLSQRHDCTGYNHQQPLASVGDCLVEGANAVRSGEILFDKYESLAPGKTHKTAGDRALVRDSPPDLMYDGNSNSRQQDRANQRKLSKVTFALNLRDLSSHPLFLQNDR